MIIYQLLINSIYYNLILLFLIGIKIMTKINISLSDLEDETVMDEIDSEPTYISSNTIRNESLRFRDKEQTYGNKSKSRKARREVI